MSLSVVTGEKKGLCELAGLETLKCEVKELTRDEAIIVMVESNLQRSVILPSEKAFAYKMRLEAMKRQAGRPPKMKMRRHWRLIYQKGVLMRN